MSAKSKEYVLSEFPNFFSPMLVKELRQGLRTHFFTIAFILLQTFMILCLMIGAAEPGTDETGGYFWFFIVVSMLVIQPLRGFSALTAEFTLNTMDLIQLTRLDAWRITLGKWTALNAQTLLLATAILPYLVMRYFIGGVNFIQDLGIIGMILLASALASAVTIGCSSMKNYVLRVLLLICCYIGFQSMTILIMGPFASSSGTSAFSRVFFPTLFAVWGCYFFLSFGASRIADRSENHSQLKRPIAVGSVLIIFIAGYFFDTESGIIYACIMAALSALDAVTEPPPLFNSVLRPYAKNPLKRLLAYWLTPGWHTGIIHFIILSLLCGSAIFCLQELKGGTSEEIEQSMMVTLSLTTALAFPLLLVHLFFKRWTSTQMHFGVYMFVQTCLLIISILVFSVANTATLISDKLFAWVPLPIVTFLGIMNDDIEDYDYSYFQFTLISILLISLGVSFLRGRSYYREMRAIMKNEWLESTEN